MPEPRHDDPDGPYTVWVDHGYEGWKPVSFDTFAEALKHPTYSSRWAITRPVKVVEEVA